jgi:hypothetical protein
VVDQLSFEGFQKLCGGGGGVLLCIGVVQRVL